MATLLIYGGAPSGNEFRLRLLAGKDVPASKQVFPATQPNTVCLCNVDAQGDVVDLIAIYELTESGKLRQVRNTVIPDSRYVRDQHGHITV